VFGLGAILCEILTGQPPFTGRDVSEVLGRSAHGDLTDTFARLDGCGADAELVQLTKACLAVKADDRPRDGSAVAAQVAAYRAGVEERLRRAELERAAAEVRAVEERRRRRAQLALAGAVLLLLTVGGAGGWYVRQQGLERQAEQARQETERVRQEGERTAANEVDFSLVEQARRGPKPDLNEAAKLLARIEARLEQGGDEAVRERLRSEQADLDRVRRDQQMVAKLEDARMQAAAATKEGLDLEGSRQLFAAAFAWYELDVLKGAEEEVAARIGRSPIREELVTALDSWSSRSAAAEARRLRMVACLADANAWRRELREAILRSDTDLIHRLGEAREAAELPPASLIALAAALQRAKASRKALDLLREGLQRNPADFWLNCQLAEAFRTDSSPEPAEAVCYHRAARALRPESVVVLNNLGLALYAQGKLPEAVVEYREAIRLKPDYPTVHLNLGSVLSAQGKLPEAVVEYREAIRLKPDYPLAHCGLGNTLREEGKLPEAVAECREAIRLKPDFPEAHTNLGNALFDQGKLPEAVAEYREAIRLKPDEPLPHNGLANALRAQGKLPEAVAEYREAIRLKPDYPLAHINLGFALRNQAQFEASLAALRYGHELGSKAPGWRHPSEQWVKEAERLVELDRRLPDVLDGRAQPANAAEQIEFARVCALKRRRGDAVRLYADAFQADASLADDLGKSNRYNAACYAALAAAGKDEGPKALEEPERARLRSQALAWLRDDLAAWGKRLDSGKPEDRPPVQRKMRHWQQDADVTGVRDTDALAKLPEAERAEWTKFWRDVDALLKRAEPK
jgi:tetratricopeptide (TPR) repeat protein